MATDLDMQAFVVAYQEAWASREPGAMRALWHLNPDYRAISPEDWRSLGVAARHRCPTGSTRSRHGLGPPTRRPGPVTSPDWLLLTSTLC